MFSFGRIKGLLVVGAIAGSLFISACDNPAAMNESTANVKHITQADFTNEVMRATEPVVADFYATWCGPCRGSGALIEDVAGGYAGKIKFVKVNVDESTDLALAYHADALPLLLIFKNGEMVDHVLGTPEKADLKSKLDALLAAKQ